MTTSISTACHFLSTNLNLGVSTKAFNAHAVEIAFFGVITQTPLERAIAQVEAWLEAPGLVLLGETGSYWPELRVTLTTGRISGPQVHDARIAALCRLHGVQELWTSDRDFGRFPGLKTTNPLVR